MQESPELTQSLARFEGQPDSRVPGVILCKAARDVNRRAYWTDRANGMHAVGDYVIYDGGVCRGRFPDSNAAGQFVFAADPPLSGNKFSTIVGHESPAPGLIGM